MAIDLVHYFENEPAPLDCVWSGFVAGTVGCLAAAGSTGKSFFAIEVAMGVASNRANAVLLNFEIPKHGKAVIMNAEDPESVIGHRIHAIGKMLDPVARKDVAQNLVITPLMGEGVNIMDDIWLDKVLEAGKDARLIVFDTFSRWHRMKENDNGEMATVVARFERVAKATGAAVLFLHHVSKGMAMNGRQDEQQATRGAAAITDNCRWQGFMQKMTPEEAQAVGIQENKRSQYVSFGGNKENYGVSTPTQWLHRVEGGVLLPANIGVGGHQNADPLPAQKPPVRKSANLVNGGNW